MYSSPVFVQFFQIVAERIALIAAAVYGDLDFHADDGIDVLWKSHQPRRKGNQGLPRGSQTVNGFVVGINQRFFFFF